MSIKNDGIPKEILTKRHWSPNQPLTGGAPPPLDPPWTTKLIQFLSKGVSKCVKTLFVQ